MYFWGVIIKTKAVVLHSFKYGDLKLIVDMLTESRGRVSCIARVSKSGQGRVNRQLFQPLTLLEVMIEQRPSTRLMPLKEARALRPFVSIPFSPSKLSIAMFTAEFLCSATRGDMVDRAMYSYIENSLLWLDECIGRFANFHLVFAMRLTRFLGFYPNTEHYSEGDWFDLRSGCFVSQAPPHPDSLVPMEARLIGLMLRMNFPTMHLYRMTRQERNRLLEIILLYYRIHVPGFRELKSVDVLRELF